MCVCVCVCVSATCKLIVLQQIKLIVVCTMSAWCQNLCGGEKRESQLCANYTCPTSTTISSSTEFSWSDSRITHAPPYMALSVNAPPSTSWRHLSPTRRNLSLPSLSLLSKSS